MITWWAYPYIEQQAWVVLISWTFWVLLSITLHELAHAYTATWQGDQTPRQFGRLSLNPLVHMGSYSIIAFILIGLAWGVTPVNPARFRWGRMGRILVAAAGPATNLLIAILCSLIFAAIKAWSPAEETGLSQNLLVLFQIGIAINLLLLFFNLLPVPPLDGSQILAAAFRPLDRLFSRPGAPLFGLAVIMVIFLSGFDGLINMFVNVQSQTLETWSSSLFPSSGG